MLKRAPKYSEIQEFINYTISKTTSALVYVRSPHFTRFSVTPVLALRHGDTEERPNVTVPEFGHNFLKTKPIVDIIFEEARQSS